MRSRSNFITLKNGLRLAYEEYGDPAGEPVIFCHGWPSSGTQAALTHKAACEAGVRMIAPDRPGLGHSQFQPGRTFSDWVPVMKEFTAALGIGRYRVLAVSGGAPYGYAMAGAMPDSVAALAVVSGAVPLAEHKNPRQLLYAYVWLMAIYRKYPGLLRLMFRCGRPFALYQPRNLMKPLLVALQTPADQLALKQPGTFDACFESSRAAWLQGSEGVLLDAELYVAPWGFDVEDIRVPVRLWHGKLDRSFACELAGAMAARIPGCTTNYVENEGHYSLPILHVKRILEDLKAAI
jgi:pimeloyl-ACP methyl ester carboxylesterase